MKPDRSNILEEEQLAFISLDELNGSFEDAIRVLKHIQSEFAKEGYSKFRLEIEEELFDGRWEHCISVYGCLRT